MSIAWAATDETCTKVEALGFNKSRRFDTPLYLHPPAASDLVERIRALEIAEPMGWMDRCHNGVVAKIVELIEGAK